MTVAKPDLTNAGLLRVRDLTVEFKARGRAVRAVDRVSLSIGKGETVGLVGESGSGKSTIAKAILGLVPSAGGVVQFDGVDITHAKHRVRRRMSEDLQAVFQDPYSQLSPTRTIGQTLAEPVQIHRKVRRHELDAIVGKMLDAVGLPGTAADRYPSQFSGGQRQRIAIARALMLSPKLVVCDEPTSALDISIQAQILNLLADLQESIGVSYLLVSHDLAVVRLTAQRVVVLYRGQVMESGPADVVCGQPLHPYTRMLLDSAPVPDVALQRKRREARAERSRVPLSAVGASGNSGCPFAARCVFATEQCRTVRPSADTLPNGVTVACHNWKDIQGSIPLGDHGVPLATGSSDIAGLG